MKLIETVQSRKSNFVFSALAAVTGFDLWTAGVGSSMDRLYLSVRSGQKPASLVVEDDYDKETESLDLADLASIIYNTYNTKWAKLFEDLSTEYVWNNNYSYTETETIDITHDKDLERSSEIESGKTTNTATSVTTTDQLAAYNSGLKDATKSTVVGAKNANEQEESSSTTDNINETETKSEEGTRVREKEGVMGVPLTELLKNDVSFWQSTSLLDIIFSDVDKILTLPYYE